MDILSAMSRKLELETTCRGGGRAPQTLTKEQMVRGAKVGRTATGCATTKPSFFSAGQTRSVWGCKLSSRSAMQGEIMLHAARESLDDAQGSDAHQGSDGSVSPGGDNPRCRTRAGGEVGRALSGAFQGPVAPIRAPGVILGGSGSPGRAL